MKVIAFLFATLALVGAFAPSQQSRQSTKLYKAFWDNVFEMDLFEPVKDQNNYGARSKMKKLSQGSITDGSYVPAGLTADQYKKVRAKDSAKASANYDKNVKKAFKFLDYTQFYKQRGTDTNDNWYKSPTRGHTMTKLKYDPDTSKFGKKYDGSK